MAEKNLFFALHQGGASPGWEKKSISGNEIPYVEWLLPGIITLNVMFLSLWGVGWVIVRQRKTGVLKRFNASPLTALEYLAAQGVSRIGILLFTGGTVFCLSLVIYPFHMRGSALDLLVAFILGCAALSSIGLLVAARMSSDEFANGIINVISYPMMFLSEIFFSLEGSPEWVKTAAQGVPLWHMTDMMRKIVNEGIPLHEMAGSAVYLGIFATVLLIAGAWTFKWTRD